MSLPSESDLSSRAAAAATACGVDLAVVAGTQVGRSPVNGLPVSSLAWSTPADVEAAVARSAAAYDTWRLVPAPARGAVVRRFGELLREHLDDLATLVTLEVGKIGAEARGEVQEMVDICDYAVGLSRQLFGRTMPS
ncbi:MAG: aldehyde dehydrogenase family protein, partial [Nocardioides sp.]